jgi:hypothetical protein
MNRVATSKPAASWLIAVGLLGIVFVGSAASDDTRKASSPIAELPTADEARERAKLLHETIHSTLHVVHHHYYREDEELTIPGVALKRVFRELAESRNVRLRWLAVNAQAMNVEHNPNDEFEKNAVAALASGRSDFELTEDGLYRYVGSITLGSECLKCHLPNRKSTKDRVAGLVISMPIKKN